MFNSLRIIAPVAAVATVTWIAVPAEADHGDWIRPDNATQRVDSSGTLTNYGIDAMYRGANQLGRSDITIKWGTGGKDIVVFDYTYGDTGWYGQTKCVDNLGGNFCGVFEVRFNESNMPNSTSKWESLGCHEFGHTGGLNHRGASNDSNDNSCMRVSIWPRSLDNHDIAEVNANV